MSEDLEAILRSELSQRAAVTPITGGDLADTAIAGAGRIRRRRRVGAVAGGLGLVVVAAATVVTTPWNHNGITDRPSAANTTTEEAQEDLAIEFVVRTGDGYAVVNTDGEYIDLQVDEAPTAVDRLAESYLVTSTEFVQLVATDGSTAAEFPVDGEDFMTVVRGDATEFAVEVFELDSDILRVDIHAGSMTGEPEPTRFELDTQVSLLDWGASTAVLQTDLASETAYDPGGWWLEDNYAWGLNSIAEAGYEAAVIADFDDPSYVCVSDLDPGVSAADQEQCGFLGDSGEMEAVIAEASDDPDATELVSTATTRAFEEQVGISTDALADDGSEDEFWMSQEQYLDPSGRWRIGYNPGDETWSLFDFTNDRDEFSELEPPDGALFPVMSYT